MFEVKRAALILGACALLALYGEISFAVTGGSKSIGTALQPDVVISVMD